MKHSMLRRDPPASGDKPLSSESVEDGDISFSKVMRGSSEDVVRIERE